MVSKTQAPDTNTGTREAVLDAAASLLAKGGFQGMTMDEVARRAGLGKGTAYIYFESKRDLALSVFDRMNARLRHRLADIARGPGSPEQRLRRLLVERVMYRFDCARDYQASIDEILACLRPMLLDRRQTYMEQEAIIFVELLVEGRTLGIFECDDPLRTAHAFLTATASLLPFSLSPAELGSRKLLEARAGFMADILLKSVLRPKASN